MVTLVPSKNVKQSFLSVSVEQDSDGPKLWRVHIRKGPAVPYGQHPAMLPSEAERLHVELGNAVAEAYRLNVRRNIP